MDYVSRTYGHTGQIFEMKDPEYPIYATYLAVSMDIVDDGMIEEYRRGLIKSRSRIEKENKLEVCKKQVYATIWTKMSLQSQAKVESYESFNDLIPQRSDPLKFLNIIKQRHMSYGETNTDKAIFKVLTHYYRMYQSVGESVSELKKRRDAHVSAMEALGADITDQAQLVYDFVRRLNKKYYGSAMNEYDNGVYGKFTTVEQAYMWAFEYKSSYNGEPDPMVFNSIGDDEEQEAPVKVTAHKTSMLTIGGEYRPSKEKPCHECGGTDPWSKDGRMHVLEKQKQELMRMIAVK